MYHSPSHPHHTSQPHHPLILTPPPHTFTIFLAYPSLAAHIRGPFRTAIEGTQIRTMPNSFLPPSPTPVPGVVLLGDAFNMRHPLTGGGMSVALNDVVIWRRLLKDVRDLEDHDMVIKCLRRFEWERKGSHAFVVNVLAQALYQLFSASDGISNVCVCVCVVCVCCVCVCVCG